MEGAGAVLSEGSAVLGSGVAFVRGKTVLRELCVELAEEVVAVDLGDDRGGGDGEAERVAVIQLGLCAGVVDEHGVDDEVVGSVGELLDGGEHSHTGGLVDVDAVDGFGIDFSDGVGESDAADFAIEFFALLAGELFGVGEAHAGEDAGFFRQDNGGCNDGTEERAAADFVNASDAAVAMVAESLLGGVGADELLEHLLLGRGLGDADGDRNAEERRHDSRDEFSGCAGVQNTTCGDRSDDEALCE